VIIFNYTIRVLVRLLQKARPDSCVETLYLKGLYERLTLPSGNVEHKYYVGNTVVIDSTDAKQSKTLYTHKDHLGSTVTVTDANGSVVQHINYDAWGKQNRFYTSSSLVSLLNQQSPVESKGYTGHKEISDLGIIHMNGRIYDPILGRFLQADPIIQAPTDSQSYNRYAYVRNNPLTLTDPSGYSWISKTWKKVKKYVGAIAAIVVAVYCQVCGATMWNAAMTGAAIGAGSAAINGGNVVTGALRGAFSAAAFYGVGQTFEPGTFGNVVGNATVGGIMSDLNGGNFGHGFWAAGLSAAAKPAMYKKFGYSPDNAGARVVTAAVIGGTASKISGGKFANGAITAAFSQLFNGESYAKRKWQQIQDLAKRAYAETQMIGNFIKDEGLNVLGRTFTVVGGGGQVLLGGGLCTTGLGCVLGAPIATLGASNIQEGLTGEDGFVRDFAQDILGETNGDYAVGALNLGTSIGGLSRSVLKPIPTSQSRPLFYNIPNDYAPAFTQSTNVGLGVEGIGSVLNLYDTYDRTK